MPSYVLDSIVELDLGKLFRSMMAGQVAGVSHYTAPASWGWPKVVKKPDYDVIKEWGVPQMLNFESSIDSWMGGRAAGLREGKAGAIGRAEMGHDREVYYSADMWINPQDFGLLADYMHGVADANGGVVQGFYGEADAFNYLFSRHLICRAWQSQSLSFPGNRTRGQFAVLTQITNKVLPQFPPSLYDASIVNGVDWGQSPNPKVSTPLPKPVPTPTAPPRGPHMKFSPHVIPGGGGDVASQDAPGGGTWVLQADGGIRTYGSAQFYGAFVGLLVAGDAWDDLRLPTAADASVVGPSAHYVAVSVKGHIYGR